MNTGIPGLSRDLLGHILRCGDKFSKNKKFKVFDVFKIREEVSDLKSTTVLQLRRPKKIFLFRRGVERPPFLHSAFITAVYSTTPSKKSFVIYCRAVYSYRLPNFANVGLCERNRLHSMIKIGEIRIYGGVYDFCKFAVFAVVH